MALLRWARRRRSYSYSKPELIKDSGFKLRNRRKISHMRYGRRRHIENLPPISTIDLKFQVRCCNKLHKVILTTKGDLKLADHDNIMEERLLSKMANKSIRCLDILDAWRGQPSSEWIAHVMPPKLYERWARTVLVNEERGRQKKGGGNRSSVFDLPVNSERFGAVYGVSALERMFSKEFYKSELYRTVRAAHKDPEKSDPQIEVTCNPYTGVEKKANVSGRLAYSNWCWSSKSCWRLVGYITHRWLQLAKAGEVHLPGGLFAVDIIDVNDFKEEYFELRKKFVSSLPAPFYLAYRAHPGMPTMFDKVYLQKDINGRWFTLSDEEN